MLFARAISNGVKWYTPDVFAGPVYVPEEMENIQVTEDVKHEDVKPDPQELEQADPQELEQAIANIALCDTKKDLTDLKKTTPAYIISDASFIAAGKARYEIIMSENANVPLGDIG
jgi:hypothetical protein